MYKGFILSSCVGNIYNAVLYLLVLCYCVNSRFIAIYHGAVQGADPGSITQ